MLWTVILGGSVQWSADQHCLLVLICNKLPCSGLISIHYVIVNLLCMQHYGDQIGLEGLSS